MDLWVATKREERNLEKQLAKIQHELKGVKAAAKAKDQTKHPATKEYEGDL